MAKPLSRSPDAVDARVGDLLIEVKAVARGARAIRDGIWSLAAALSGTPGLRGLLVLHRPEIGSQRLAAEQQAIEAILRPEVSRRIRWVVIENDGLESLPKDLGPRVRNVVARLIAGGDGKRRTPPERGFATLAVLHVLLDRWLRSAGPVHTNELMATVGCSYPTVATALAEFRDDIVRHRDRRVELSRWPRLGWLRYVSVQERARATEKYTDRSGSPRSAADLIRRLERLERSDIAVGGVPGALHYMPSLDVVGTATLALTLHDPEGRATTDFVERLDPALVRTETAESAPHLVIHRQRLRRFLASEDESGPRWADPVECLLDLHEAGLEGLAKHYLDTTVRQRSQRT
jgi:hypothetical protein